ncbi:MAG TPA: hypothetical protein VLH38_04270 [Patescibacteria group bacterium]|nr:hypothetical protein [Patescibacteria group bacterium]
MYIVASIVLLIAGLLGGAYLTNPFNRITIIKRPFVLRMVATSFQTINHNHRLRIRQQWWWRWFAIVKCGIHILNTRWVRSPRSHGASVDAIIADIHKKRFDPHRLLLTSGDHFSALFVRNLGVFYYPILDTRIAGSTQDWEHRQIVYLQTIAYALGVFDKHRIPTTTIVSTGPYQATCVNFYAYPSDTVYGILFAIAALLGEERAAATDYAKPVHRLRTKAATRLLMNQYQGTMQALYEHYRATVFDGRTGLVRADVHLSGAKDITRRESAFYDNVVFWKTTQLATTLGLIPKDTTFLATLKQHILTTFWLEEEGYFLEDISEEGRQKAYYSSDWLFVLTSGFLDPADPMERSYFIRSVAYIQKRGIDQPLPIKYQHETRAHRQFLAVRLAVASYGGDAIWSFWGMEYIKVLLLLYTHTGNEPYRLQAEKHIAAYERVMLREGGFPEVLDSRGQFLQTLLYRSIRQTGWVIGFEQVRAMHAAYTKGPHS